MDLMRFKIFDASLFFLQPRFSSHKFLEFCLLKDLKAISRRFDMPIPTKDLSLWIARD
jgi:hypothetical protein